jgi:protease-4
MVVRIDSPGGGVSASDMLYHELKKFKQDTGIKMVAHFLDTGASGGYYTALAADRITAQPTTITGSIGVTMYRVDATADAENRVKALKFHPVPRKGWAHRSDKFR